LLCLRRYDVAIELGTFARLNLGVFFQHVTSRGQTLVIILVFHLSIRRDSA
jgi:hypothetical protein